MRGKGEGSSVLPSFSKHLTQTHRREGLLSNSPRICWKPNRPVGIDKKDQILWIPPIFADLFKMIRQGACADTVDCLNVVMGFGAFMADILCEDPDDSGENPTKITK